MQNSLGCLSLCARSKRRRELSEFPGFWPTPSSSHHGNSAASGPPRAGIKGQAEPGVRGGTRIQINQTSWEILAAPSVSPGLAERDGEEKGTSFPWPLEGAAAHPAEGREIDCSHQSGRAGAGKRLEKTYWELGDGK